MTAAEAAYGTGSASETRSVEHGKRGGSSRTFATTGQGALGVLPGFKQEACKVRWKRDSVAERAKPARAAGGTVCSSRGGSRDGQAGAWVVPDARSAEGWEGGVGGGWLKTW